VEARNEARAGDGGVKVRPGEGGGKTERGDGGANSILDEVTRLGDGGGNTERGDGGGKTERGEGGGNTERGEGGAAKLVVEGRRVGEGGDIAKRGGERGGDNVEIGETELSSSSVGELMASVNPMANSEVVASGMLPVYTSSSAICAGVGGAKDVTPGVIGEGRNVESIDILEIDDGTWALGGTGNCDKFGVDTPGERTCRASRMAISAASCSGIPSRTSDR
jgi:hypothetical protein